MNRDRSNGCDFEWSDASGVDPVSLRKCLETDGFAVIRGLLASTEIENLRNIVRDHLCHAGYRFGLGKTQPNAAVALPDLAFVFAHDKIVRLFKSALGEHDVVFTGHCDVHMNMLSGWHKDSGETAGGYFRGDYFAAADCRVYKIAIYLQDAVRENALVVRRGSHRSPTLMAGEPVCIETRQGDVVLFDVRLTHTGQLPDPVEKGLKAINLLLRGRRRTKQDSIIAGALRALYWKARGKHERMSVFFTFGCPNEYTYDFAYFNLARQHEQTRVRDVELPQQLRKRLAALGVATFDATLHELWSGAPADARRSVAT